MEQFKLQLVCNTCVVLSICNEKENEKNCLHMIQLTP